MTAQKNAARLLKQTETAKTKYLTTKYITTALEAQPHLYAVCPGIIAHIGQTVGGYAVTITHTGTNPLGIPWSSTAGPAFQDPGDAQIFLDDLADDEGWGRFSWERTDKDVDPVKTKKAP